MWECGAGCPSENLVVVVVGGEQGACSPERYTCANNV